MRDHQMLREGWWIKELETPEPDLKALIAEIREGDADDVGWLSATMPAQVHDILLAQGRIPDPRIGKNAVESAWVGERDWVYARPLTSPPGTGPVFLRFQGLDTLATVYVNDRKVGEFANMHYPHTVQIREALNSPGEGNVVLVAFASPLRFIAEVEPAEDMPAYHYIRKCRSDFTSYLGARPHAVKMGIFDEVVLDVPGRGWLEDIAIDTVLADDFASAEVMVSAVVAEDGDEVAWTLTAPSAEVVLRGVMPLSEKMNGEPLVIPVDDPVLWWPRTHGQPLRYQLTLELLFEGQVLDRQSVSFGFRRVEPVLHDPKTGEDRFAFRINGERIFLRGACWAPLQGMTHCWDQAKAERLLDLVEHGEMNVLRVWGGGLMPPDAFYEACDRRGILIWQDFMFGYGMYPDEDLQFLGNCRAEISDIVKRLRHHPSILLWCGGNENHMGWDFRYGAELKPTQGRHLFEEAMPDICEALDPDRLFHPSSPYGGPVPNWPLTGDWHDYTTLTFSPHASVPLYASEIGRVSAPSLDSMRRFMDEAALWPEDHDVRIRVPGEAAWPSMWQYRSVDGSWDKIGHIEAYPDPTSAADLIRVLGTAHGAYLQRRVERHRRGLPNGTDLDGAKANRRCWGTTIWRLNDPWPIIYWSAVDAYGEPKIPYYFLRRAYAPVLITFERTPDVIWSWCVNDGPDPVSGTLTLRRSRFTGEVLQETATQVTVAPGEARRCLEATDFGPINLRSEFLWATLATESGVFSATYLLIGERYLHLPVAHLAVRVLGGDAGIEVATDTFARQVTLEIPGKTGAVFEDNFFDLAPGERRRIAVLQDAGGGPLRIGALNAEPTVLDWRA